MLANGRSMLAVNTPRYDKAIVEGEETDTTGTVLGGCCIKMVFVVGEVSITWPLLKFIEKFCPLAGIEPTPERRTT
jgi:hypothetical protein